MRSVALDLEAHDALEALGASGDLRPWFQGELAAVTEQAAALLAAEALALSKERGAPEPPRAGAARMGRFWECDVTSARSARGASPGSGCAGGAPPASTRRGAGRRSPGTSPSTRSRSPDRPSWEVTDEPVR